VVAAGRHKRAPSYAAELVAGALELQHEAVGPGEGIDLRVIKERAPAELPVVHREPQADGVHDPQGERLRRENQRFGKDGVGLHGHLIDPHGLQGRQGLLLGGHLDGGRGLVARDRLPAGVGRREDHQHRQEDHDLPMREEHLGEIAQVQLAVAAKAVTSSRY
jgi:hypothetical protein